MKGGRGGGGKIAFEGLLSTLKSFSGLKETPRQQTACDKSQKISYRSKKGIKCKFYFPEIRILFIKVYLKQGCPSIILRSPHLW